MSRARIAIAASACVVTLAVQAAGQPPAPSTPAGQTGVESDPITCWWRTDKSAVRVGEPFSVDLTCGVIDTNQVRVTVDESRLDPAALELAPFEVLDGTRHRDIDAPPWRYFQYTYRTRLIGDEYFGKDVEIPGLQMTYTVRTGASDGTRGREQPYLLPALPVRIQSLVPLTADDIRDDSPDTFASLEARQFRATAELAAAGICFSFAFVLGTLAVARRRRGRGPRAAAARRVPEAAVLRSCLHRAERLKPEASVAGWTPDLLVRALTLLRIAGAVALGQPVAQRRVAAGDGEREGQLVVRQGRFRPTRAVISASTTAAAIDERLARGNGCAPDTRTLAALEALRTSLRAFGAARYGRQGQPDRTELDEAFEQGLRAIRRLLVTVRWPRRAAGAFARRLAVLKDATWSR